MSTIVGMFDDERKAGEIISQLDGLGLEEGAIHVLSRGRVSGRDDIISSFARALQPGSGAVSGELMRLGLDREEAEFYEEELDEDSMLIAVQADGELGDRAMAILRQGNAAFRER